MNAEDGRPEQAKKKKAANSLVQLYPLPQITPSTLVIFLNRMETDESAANFYKLTFVNIPRWPSACKPYYVNLTRRRIHWRIQTRVYGNRVILRCMNLLPAVAMGLLASLAWMVWVTPLLAITASVTPSVLHGPPGSEAASGR